MPDQQQQINYGAAPNDGQGDPLRDAFIKTDDNFDAIWAAGPVGSNITILNNTVSVVDTNGNLILKPNGVGVVQANASIVPNSANIRDLGAADRRWRRIFVQTLNTVDFEVDGDLTVSGNLTIQGDTIQIGNLVTDAKTVQLSNTAANAAQASGSGITVGSNDDIATMLYDGTSNVWSMNIGITALGTINAEYFVGNGSLLTGLPASYTNTDVVNLLSSGNVVTDITTSANVSAAYILGNGSQLTGLPEQYGNSNVTTLLANFGSNAIVTTGNIEGGRLEIQNGIGNAWTIYGQRIFAPSGGEWRSEEDSGDDFITSANDGYINIQSLYAGGNIASELHLEHGTAHIRIADGPFDDWYFLSGGTMTTPGHIIPQANGMYSLGNATNQWANLWVANNTIYLGGVAIGVTGNTLTVAGEPVLSNDSQSNIATTGTITASNIVTNGISSDDSTFVTIHDGLDVDGDIECAGNITANYFIGNGSQLTGLPEQYGNANVAAYLLTYTGNIAAGNILTDNYLYANGDPFVSASTGNITFTDTTMSPPDGVDITISAANSEVIIEAFDIRLDATDDLRLTGNDIVSLRNRSTTDSITIRTDYDNNDYEWEFAVDGTLTTPGDIVTAGDVTGTAGASTLYFKAQPDSNTYIQLNNSVDSVISTVANLEVRTDVSNTAQVWQFDTTGLLTAPGNIAAANFLGNIAAANVVGTVSSAITAGTVTTAAQANITSLGNLSSLTMAGNISGVSTSDSTPPQSVTISAGDNTGGDLFNAANGGTLTLRGGDSGFNPGGALQLRGGNGSVDGDIIIGDINTTSVKIGNTSITANVVGNLTVGTNASVTGNITTGNILTDNYRYANGDPFVSGNYGDSNVVTLLSSFGSNTVSTTGNITAANFIGNISVTGNVTGTTPNVTLIAGSYSWTFDNTGIASFPAVGGDEGGEINFGIPTANTTLTGPVKVDVYRDQLRFFDGSTNGAYLDLANCPSGVSAAIGYRDIPQISFTGNTTTVANAAGRHYYSTESTDYVLTIANNTSVGWSVGTAITVVNRGTGNITVAQGTGVSLYLAGNSTAGNRTVSTYGMATLLNVAANVWMINGTGVS